ncbi:MAG TPA: response regulator transcription factor [Flavisolibacter sp.]|jgi:DNA-binding NarL/FixJ family response regulator
MFSQKILKLILADDHAIYRDGLKLLLKKVKDVTLEVAAEAGSGAELVELADSIQPDMVITDIMMPGMDGISAIRLLRKKHPQLFIIALSSFDETRMVLDTLEAGANAYLLKNTSKEEMLQAIKAVSEGGAYYCSEVSVLLIKKIKESNLNSDKKPQVAELTPREQEIIKLICKGHSNKEIATILNLSKRTVEGYREKIMSKVQARNSLDIMTYAIKNNLYKI